MTYTVQITNYRNSKQLKNVQFIDTISKGRCGHFYPIV
ncbi:hypothetical protein CW304_10190 [Bacillus sp. UFRGS-B20]|nr:hypothetical protein CW304_10190 [Bacillus sp. UFRGS-B20]